MIFSAKVLAFTRGTASDARVSGRGEVYLYTPDVGMREQGASATFYGRWLRTGDEDEDRWEGGWVGAILVAGTTLQDSGKGRGR